MLRTSAINLVLKVGLALSCVAFIVISLLYTDSIIDFYPQFIIGMIGEVATVIIGCAAALVMAIWLFMRKHKFACTFTFVIILLIGMITNFDSLRFLSIVWPLFIITLSLAIRYYPRVRIIVPHKDGERMKIVPIKSDSEEVDEEHIEDEYVDSNLVEESKSVAHVPKKEAQPAPKVPTATKAPIAKIPVYDRNNNKSSDRHTDNRDTTGGYANENLAQDIVDSDEDEPVPTENISIRPAEIEDQSTPLIAPENPTTTAEIEESAPAIISTETSETKPKRTRKRTYKPKAEVTEKSHEKPKRSRRTAATVSVQ